MRLTTMRVRANAVRHKAFVRLFSSMAPYYIVNEFPKSGGTWLAQMLSAAFELPFRRNQPIRFEPSVTHGHFLSPFMLRNVVLIWRDPRDIIVSYYFHCYFENEHHNKMLVSIMKSQLPFSDYNDIRANLPDFIRFVTETPNSPSFSWPRFARVWSKLETVSSTSYEALRVDPSGELERLFFELSGTKVEECKAEAIAEEFSFYNQKSLVLASGAASEKSFLREGSVGGWKRHFSLEAEVALERGGYYEPMRALGYT
jgi:hypothetical protein